MESVLFWGLGFIRGLQQISNPFLTAIMKGASFLGTQWFFIIALPFIYWCVDKRRGLRLGILVFFSAFTNLFLKDLWMQPRPYDLDPSVGMAREPSFGMPSGHSQGSAVFWSGIAPLLRKPFGLILAVFLPFSIGFSRVYLGVHFPTDVVAGWCIGIAFVIADYALGDRIGVFLAGLRENIKLAFAAAMALGMNAINMQDTMIAGAFFGLAVGVIYAPRVAPFDVAGGYGIKILRFLAGMAGTGALYLLPKLAFASFEIGNEALVRFIRYGLIGAWVSIGAPMLFMKIGLAQVEAVPSQAAEPQSLSLKL